MLCVCRGGGRGLCGRNGTFVRKYEGHVCMLGCIKCEISNPFSSLCQIYRQYMRGGLQLLFRIYIYI